MKTPKIRFSILALCIFTLFSFISTTTQAQNSPACLPDCPQSLFTPAGFIPPVELQVPGQPGCILRVTYGYRNACGIWHDFYIYNIEAIGNCDPGFLADPNAVVQTATTLLFMSNPPTDPNGTTVGPTKPNCGDVNCVTNWRVIKGACWREYSEGLYYECQTTTCCLQPYQICRDYCDNITVTNFGASGGGECPTGEPGCMSVCH